MSANTKPESPEVRVFADANAVADAAAREIVAAARASIAARGRFTIALSGGDTPRPLYELLGTRYAKDIDWSRVEVFFGDERCVPPEDAQSNYALAYTTMLSRVAIDPRRVHRMYEANDPPAGAAERYETLLRGFFTASGEHGPTFDVALQGIGPDGHTASLFPFDPALKRMARWVVAVRAPDIFAVRHRVTLTLPCLDRSRLALFLATGESKRVPVSRAFRDDPMSADAVPAARVHGVERTCWLLDAAAAGQLEGTR